MLEVGQREFVEAVSPFFVAQSIFLLALNCVVQTVEAEASESVFRSQLRADGR